MEEIHLFIIWSKALDKENEIKSLSESDIKERTFNLKKSVQNGDLKLSEINKVVKVLNSF